jgi:16S rRNA (adenine1518-N6/adenine1519-N6)-dimethyltransferase
LGRIVEAASLGPSDTVVEIGAGPGRLTAMLSDNVAKVLAIELDRELCEGLTNTLSGRGNVSLVCGDALGYPYQDIRGPFKVVANIPYHITTPIIFRLLEHRRNLVSMTLTVQKEVAERIAAGPGTKAYGVLSLMVQYHCRAELKFVIPRAAFRPVPKVDSACLHMAVLDSPAVDVREEEVFHKIIRTAFSQRRKTLRNSLKNLSPDMEDILAEAGIDPSLRAEALDINKFARLADVLYSHKK